VEAEGNLSSIYWHSYLVKFKMLLNSVFIVLPVEFVDDRIIVKILCFILLRDFLNRKMSQKKYFPRPLVLAIGVQL
jgi:hypothetical protein